MEKKKKNSRFSLTLLFGGIVFVNLLLVALVQSVFGFILIKAGMITEMPYETVQSPGILVILIVISVIIGAGISVLVSRIMMTPVNKFINAMQELSRGNFSVRLDMGKVLGRHPTMKELTDSFNKMAEELGRTEILRSDFVNNFSHEFKTPIVSIAGFAKLLKRGNLTEEQKAEYTDIIEEESLRLSDMATNVLNLTKIENQTILTDVKKFNLSEQIRGCILLLEHKWEKKELSLDVDFDEYEISANEEMLKQVWINLLDNAIKFADVGGSISVNIFRIGKRLQVSVSNTGSTIAPEERDRIFRKFYQADESHAQEGNGIGLAIVQGIVRLHKGEVGITDYEDRTEFTVSLPSE